nr:Uma2 family endonuclease [Synechococcus sp. PCC 7336]
MVEVASPSTASTDYRAKRTEYAVLDIAEYWIVDPLEGRVTVCTLVDGFYDTAEFRGSEAIQSGRFEDGLLSAEQILNP